MRQTKVPSWPASAPWLNVTIVPAAHVKEKARGRPESAVRRFPFLRRLRYEPTFTLILPSAITTDATMKLARAEARNSTTRHEQFRDCAPNATCRASDDGDLDEGVVRMVRADARRDRTHLNPVNIAAAFDRLRLTV
ncbi:hypothetical protein M3A49_14450 [Paraburkholderia sp. CNPSo 3076]|uniref:hypothetical protein n=1 Tax=Paraburkholderia sp. CNPSo 3076 TaxID=2940936 RepID=UPI00225988C4|nr:hypothetical protein [Paraburkholderia sp. CNPSo 3076]MCX5540681.1 hypothetical protein [Paraburkholderia sp. CNPSo 3076]